MSLIEIGFIIFWVLIIAKFALDYRISKNQAEQNRIMRQLLELRYQAECELRGRVEELEKAARYHS